MLRGPAPTSSGDDQVHALVSIGVSESDARAAVAGQWDPAERDHAHDVFDVWPCNWGAVQIFSELPPSAWDIPQLGGAVRGLRRDQVMHDMLLRGIRRTSWPKLFEQLRVLESAVLEALR